MATLPGLRVGLGLDSATFIRETGMVSPPPPLHIPCNEMRASDKGLPMQRVRLFHRYPKATLIIINVVLIIVMIGMSEVALRSYIPYDIGYYSSVRKTSNTMIFAYGAIPVNSVGGYDEEFNLESARRRVGYFGDSVIFGLGAGYPHRISEIVERAFPSLEHWNLSFGIGTRLYDEEVIRRARSLDLDLVVYVMNLNDISPTARQEEERDIDEKTIGLVLTLEKYYIGPLRDQSYLYNFLRTSAKNVLQRFGYQESGSEAIEFWPSDHEAVVADFARDVFSLAQRLEAQGTRFCVLIVPYEMQISKEAERMYSGMGFRWEEGFEKGLTQDLLLRHLAGMTVYDARDAFDRNQARIGEYFVYNMGDKIDWNHPNRKGHERIAAGFIESRGCGFLSEFEEEARRQRRRSGLRSRRRRGPGGCRENASALETARAD